MGRIDRATHDDSLTSSFHLIPVDRPSQTTRDRRVTMKLDHVLCLTKWQTMTLSTYMVSIALYHGYLAAVVALCAWEYCCSSQWVISVALSRLSHPCWSSHLLQVILVAWTGLPNPPALAEPEMFCASLFVCVPKQILSLSCRLTMNTSNGQHPPSRHRRSCQSRRPIYVLPHRP